MKTTTHHTITKLGLLSTAAVLAAALAPASAMAQTNVTVFGQISQALTKSTGTSMQLATTGFGSGIGFKGTEDLGGGLSAYFHFENRFDADTGAVGTPFWAERMAVGLTGGFGRFELGRFSNAVDLVSGLADPFGETVANMPHENGAAEAKWDNSIGYYTPAFGPVTAAFTFSTNEAPNKHVAYAANLKYAEGPATAAIAYARNGGDDVKTFTVAGNYDFGPAKLYAGYTRSTDLTGSSGHARNWQVGVGVPLSAAGTLKAAYSNYKFDTSTGDKDSKFGLGYWYNMSKRTMLYADVSRLNKTRAGVDSDVNAIDVGIFHKF